MAIQKVPIEVDITYTNQSWSTGHKRKDTSKHYVIGFYQRDKTGTAIIKTIPDNNPETIIKAIYENVAKGSIIYSEENLLPEDLVDDYDIYELMPSDGHANGDLHINNVKNMWKDLKRCIKREHVQVSKKHLQSYCNEVAWRINHRHLSPSEKFNALFGAMARAGKCTFQDLVK